MKNLHYLIHLEPDLEEFLFQGRTEITWNSEESIDHVILNAKDLGIFSCKLEFNNQSNLCAFSIFPENEEVKVEFNKLILGDIRLIIHFHGHLNENLLGFYRSKYEIDGKEKYSAVTQFEEREARAAFPCFDHPSKKATFNIEFLIKNCFQGIANTPIIEEIPDKNGKKLVKFETTPIMSTYVLFFGVGDYKFLEDNDKLPSIRAVAVPDKIEYGKFAVEFGRKSIDWLENYTGIPFPIKKCDYIAVSDFAFGAMENYGAITFRENALLVYPGRTSLPQLTQIAEIIAHETAHMWFGNLVTPLDWKFIWLNESFASYFTVAIPDHYHPEWHLWDRFTLDSTLDGLERDSLVETIPIELPGDEEARIDFSTAPIIYNKGAAIIRMLVGYLGADKFKIGVNFFLDKFKFGCANSENYWNAFEEATGEPIKYFADSWVHQKGFPLIEVKREGNNIIFNQERFTYNPVEVETTWLIPLNIQVFNNSGEKENKKILFKEKHDQIALSEGFKGLKLNSKQDSFYRVKYSEDLQNMLGELVLNQELDYMDRFGIQNDLYSFVKRGDYAVADYLSYMNKYYVNEDNDLVLLDAARNINDLLLVKSDLFEEFQKIGTSIFEAKLERIGYEPKENDSLQLTTLRSTLIKVLYLLNSVKAKQFALEKFEILMKGGTINPNLNAVVIGIGGAEIPEAKNFLLSKLEDEKTAEMEKLYALQGLGMSKIKSNLIEFLQLGFTKVPKKNRLAVLRVISENRYAIEWLWDWYRENFELIKKEVPMFHVGASIPFIVKYAGRGHEKEIVEFLEEQARNLPPLEATIKMGIEIMDIYSKIH